MKVISQGLRFSVEIATIFTIIYCGFKYYTGVKSFLIGIILPCVLVVIWSVFMAPKSDNRLGEEHRIIFEIILFTLVSFLLYFNKNRYTSVYTILAIISTILDHIYK